MELAASRQPVYLEPLCQAIKAALSGKAHFSGHMPGIRQGLYPKGKVQGLANEP